MIQINILYNGKNITIQANINDKMNEILKKFLIKAELEDKSVYYIYKGNIIDKELELEKIIGEEDKNLNKMNIIANIKEEIINNEIIKSRFIICPECKEKTFIKIEDYRIELYNCKNGHKIKDILLDKYEELQKIDISKIICEECKENKMSNTYDNKFYKCNNCKINLCPLCYSTHNKEHNIINYDSKDIICNIHKELFISYCNECKINICLSCFNNHKGHDCISFQNILPDIDKIRNEKEELRNLIDKMNENIKEIIKKLNKVSENMEIYYRIYNDILNNYENKNRNYELIKSINEINNINIIKDIKEINNDENINDKCCNILNIYNKMINNKINEKKEKIYDFGKYIGSLKNGLREGKGIFYWNDGDRYEGDYKNDKKEGKGI